ncbi:MAG: hypothetical protein KDA32_14550, partial [Phycisphaerales bacterium]|nr:hypothetical protein [Phycisphaerales bacterium]
MTQRRRTGPLCRPLAESRRSASHSRTSPNRAILSMPIRRALISVFDKTGVVDFARELRERFDVELLSTGGTAKLLTEAGLTVTLVETVTGFAEMLDGRVKTLSPFVHGAILADRDNPDHLRQLQAANITPIDMVVVNLYDFDAAIAQPACTLADAIEMIDIGGPCMLRAAAKNHKHVVVVPSAAATRDVLVSMRETGDVPEDLRRRLAADAYFLTAGYDGRVSAYLDRAAGETGAAMRATTQMARRGGLRYGENPHQAAAIFESVGAKGAKATPAARVDADEVECSYNNYVDCDAALRLCVDLDEGGARLVDGSAPDAPIAACVFIKHTNACGVGVATGDNADSREAAYRRAYLGDPNAAMGGILAVNFEVGAAFAETMMTTLSRFQGDAAACEAPPQAFFVEALVAPRITPEAMDVIRGRGPEETRKAWGRRVRLIEVGPFARWRSGDLLETRRALD